MSELVLLVRIALRNLFANFLNVIIGGIILVGTFCFVVGSSLLKDIDSAMSRSIIGSVAGNIQVYSAKSKDELAIFDGWGEPDLTAMPDFSRVKTSLLSVDNVKDVIPMAVSGAFIAYGNTVDMALEKLRAEVNDRRKGDTSPQNAAQIESLKSHVRQMVQVIQTGFRNFSSVSTDQAVDPRSEQALQHAGSDVFWKGFNTDPLNSLEFLENRVASLVPDADFIYLSYVGTDLDAFRKSFDRMQIVDGQMVPRGQRGVMLAKYTYEEQFKLKIAHRLDRIHEALFDEGKTIAKDPDLQDLIRQNRTQTREIVLQLDPLSTKKAVADLQGFLGSRETELPKLLSAFLDTNDANFAARFKFFYVDLAPMLELYRVRPGDLLTIKGYSKGGFVHSANLKVYGTFQFKGLEKSGLAGGLSLMDLMSFRDLYGYLTPDKLAEMKQIAQVAGARIIDRDKAESELFGGSSVVATGKEQKIDDQAELKDARNLVHSASLVNQVYSQDEIDHGVALNAAVILKDPSRLKETMQAISDRAARDGLDLRVVSWQKAAGNIGQFVLVAKIVLYSAVFIIFIVALVVINNAVMMATLQRIQEIGTMRAIGAQRGFVWAMVLVETLVLGMIFGSVGALAGSGFMKWLGHHGIAAPNDVLYFFFSGPRLFPTLGTSSLFGAFLIIVVVTTLSALYPAVIATRVSPIQAMQTED